MLASWDNRRDYIIGGDAEKTTQLAVEHWIHSAERAIQQRGRFVVALSGGSTPRAIFEAIAKNAKLDFSKIWLFWSDERAVPPDHPDSNYNMAMQSAFSKLPIPQSQIFRMKAEKEIEQNAQDYEDKIRHTLDKHLFDLVMLGVGTDGHTASLFPNTKALQEEKRLIVANYVPEQNAWRMTFTFPCINQSLHSVIYAIGPSKQVIVPKVLKASIDSPFPASKVGTAEHKALWILDNEAAKLLPKDL
jgi:6-phosphogluconolactonase